MLFSKKHRKVKPSQSKVLKQLEKQNSNHEAPLHSQLSENEAELKDVFTNCSDVVFRHVLDLDSHQYLIVYIDGMVDPESLDEDVIKPLVSHSSSSNQKNRSSFHQWKTTVGLTKQRSPLPLYAERALAGSLFFSKKLEEIL
ncbi:spore germination protein [Fictibacillus fluitans]|uniref:Spore germination protein n=1 Tax=Fictibacillus fluitans TaxID=3058422 RepID=A0ABT8HWS0_9BACL|nr:spore germination protein [Fictibacillus sp. NE201]MDN4525173.1 spore germination protein [Fictibacillus sp. NE201]